MLSHSQPLASFERIQVGERHRAGTHTDCLGEAHKPGRHCKRAEHMAQWDIGERNRVAAAMVGRNSPGKNQIAEAMLGEKTIQPDQKQNLSIIGLCGPND